MIFLLNLEDRAANLCALVMEAVDAALFPVCDLSHRQVYVAIEDGVVETAVTSILILSLAVQRTIPILESLASSMPLTRETIWLDSHASIHTMRMGLVLKNFFFPCIFCRMQGDYGIDSEDGNKEGKSEDRRRTIE